MIRFYVWECGVDSLPPEIDLHRLDVEIWRPKILSVRPKGLPFIPNVVWWVFHHFGIFSNRELGIVNLRKGSRIVHSLLATPRYFRFANMGLNDLQIGAVFTDPHWRGLGLAKAAIRIVCVEWAGRFSRLWYIVGEDNIPSIRVIEACGFRLAGTGDRVNRLGLPLLGQYRILNPTV